MTREEAIKMLRGMKADNLNLNDLYTRDKYEALVMAIKALEQEPFINKPCVSEKVCEHDKNVILGKIRTEIEQKARPNELGGRGNGKSIRYGLCMALEIIDKYAEMEAEPNLAKDIYVPTKDALDKDIITGFIDDLNEIYQKLWEVDIPHPTVPEYREHHEQIQSIMAVVKGIIQNYGGCEE